MTDKVACPRCQIGYLNVGTATYTSVYNGTLLSVPNMPAWTCDICEYHEFDFDALTQIEALIGHFGPSDAPARPASKLPSVDADAAESNLSHRIKP